jgi:hypothetical protein
MNPKRPFHAMEVIQEGIAMKHPSSTRIKKDERVIYCNLDRVPYSFCETCEIRTLCDSFHERNEKLRDLSAVSGTGRKGVTCP